MGEFILKVKYTGGSFTTSCLSANNTLKELKVEISKKTAIEPKEMKILKGFPPKPVDCEDCLKLQDCNISSGETLLVEANKTAAPVKKVKPINKNIFEKLSSNQQQNFCVQEEICLLCEEQVMQRYKVPSDNSCLFSAIYFITHNGELNLEQSNDLRKVIAEVIGNDKDKFDSTYLGRDNEDYCDWIRNPNSWGGAIELSIFSEYFKLEITFIDIMSGAILRFGQDKYLQRGLLIYDGIHYDPLMLECRHLKRTIFPNSEQRFINMAMDIVYEARSKHQFTDIKHFILLCNECGLRMQGNEEAKAHAVVTGHTNFGETKEPI